jgi:hypothetical protein
MNRHLAYLVFIMFLGWLAGMLIHGSQHPPPTAEALQKIG